MRVFRVLGLIVLVLIVLAAAAIGALWIWSPFAPPVVVTDPGAAGRRVTEDGLLANYFPGQGEGRHPGILLLGGSEGGLGRGVDRMARALQSEGYSVLHISYFRAPGQRNRLELVPLETFDRALDWLKVQSDVDAERLAVVGGSKGAEAALIVAARHPELAAVVAGMPSSVAWQGLDWNVVRQTFDPPGGSWSLAGKPIPYLPFGRPKSFGGGLVDVYIAGLADMDKHRDAIIAIEKSRAAVLLICGRADTLWPSCPMAEQVKERAENLGGPAVSVLAFDHAGHAVLGLPVEKSNPNYKNLSTFGGTPDGNNAARIEAWPKVLAHLAAALK